MGAAAAASKRNGVIIRPHGAHCGKRNQGDGDREQEVFSSEQGIDSREQAVWRDRTAVAASFWPRGAAVPTGSKR